MHYYQYKQVLCRTLLPIQTGSMSDIITNTNRFHVGRFRLFHAGRRALRRERVFRDRTKPLDIYDDFRVNRQIQI